MGGGHSTKNAALFIPEDARRILRGRKKWSGEDRGSGGQGVHEELVRGEGLGGDISNSIVDKGLGNTLRR